MIKEEKRLNDSFTKGKCVITEKEKMENFYHLFIHA